MNNSTCLLILEAIVENDVVLVSERREVEELGGEVIRRKAIPWLGLGYM